MVGAGGWAGDVWDDGARGDGFLLEVNMGFGRASRMVRLSWVSRSVF